MAFIFPQQPTIGQIVSPASSSIIYKWTSASWDAIPTTMSYATIADHAISASYALTTSYASQSLYALVAQHIVSCSTSENTSHAISSSFNGTSSLALTASYILGSTGSFTALGVRGNILLNNTAPYSGSYQWTSVINTIPQILTQSTLSEIRNTAFDERWFIVNAQLCDWWGINNSSASVWISVNGKASGKNVYGAELIRNINNQPTMTNISSVIVLPPSGTLQIEVSSPSQIFTGDAYYWHTAGTSTKLSIVEIR